MINSLSFWLKVSRPGLWFATLWLYLMPTSGLDIWSSYNFWIGFAYETKLLIIGIVAFEVGLLFFAFQEFIFGGILSLALLWLILDLVLIFKTKIYTLQQMKLFGLLSNIVALVTMTYVWYSGCLLQIP